MRIETSWLRAWLFGSRKSRLHDICSLALRSNVRKIPDTICAYDAVNWLDLPVTLHYISTNLENQPMNRFEERDWLTSFWASI